MKWYHMKGPGGTIACKGHNQNEAAPDVGASETAGDKVEHSGNHVHLQL